MEICIISKKTYIKWVKMRRNDSKFTIWKYYMDIIKKKKEVPFLTELWQKFDLSSWVIPSTLMVKLKDGSFQFQRSHWKQTKHSGDIAIFFTVIFMILVEHKCILKKWYSYIFSEMGRMLVEQGIRNGKVTLKYH